MNEAIQDWIKQAAAHPEVSGCCVRGADRSFHVKSYRESLSETKITHAMRSVSDSLQALFSHQIYAQRLKWTFENGQLLCITGPGNSLGILVVSSGGGNTEEIELLLEKCPLAQH